MSKVQESTILRGICAAIQAMQFPSLENLRELFKQNGYEIQINKIQNHELTEKQSNQPGKR